MRGSKLSGNGEIIRLFRGGRSTCRVWWNMSMREWLSARNTQTYGNEKLSPVVAFNIFPDRMAVRLSNAASTTQTAFLFRIDFTLCGLF